MGTKVVPNTFKQPIYTSLPDRHRWGRRGSSLTPLNNLITPLNNLLTPLYLIDIGGGEGGRPDGEVAEWFLVKLVAVAVGVQVRESREPRRSPVSEGREEGGC